MVGDQAGAGGHHEAAADPEQVGGAPEDLAHGLGMAADADDAGGIKPHLGLEHCRDFQQVVGGWIKKQKADRGAGPHHGHDPGLVLEIPEAHAVVAMGQEVADHHHG